MTLMERRRALMAQKAQKEWDFEWDYTQGKLEDQDGWTTDKTGTWGSTLESNGQKLWADKGAYYQIYVPSGNPLRLMTDGIGVLECKFVGHFAIGGQTSGTSGMQNFRISCAKDTTCRVTIIECADEGAPLKLRNYDSTAEPSLSTVLSTFENDVEYTIRIVLNGATADVYANGVKIGSGISTASAKFGTSNCVMIQNTGGSSYYALLKSFRLKKGRL